MSEGSYTPRPIPTDDIELSEDLVALREQLAEHNHDIWAEGRLKEGWSYGPQRDDQAKTNPCLVPYDELPDSEKEYDRSTAFGILKAILALGYRIAK